MSCQNVHPHPHPPSSCSGCPCAPVTGPRPQGLCSPDYIKCPVVCTPVPIVTDDLSVDDQLYLAAISGLISVFKDPALLCNSCDSGDLGQLLCVERCVVPFTGQEITTFKLNLESIGSGLGSITTNVYEKCNTIWFKLPCALLYDLAACAEYQKSVGSVSITKSTGCPEEWVGRILLDGICFPVSFKIKMRTELITQCRCPPYLQYVYDLVVESSFQKFFHTQSITSLDSVVGQASTMFALIAQVKAFFLEYVLSQIDSIQGATDCGPCAIGNDCSGAAPICWKSLPNVV